MSQISRQFLNNETSEKINNLFLEAIATCKNKSSTYDFLDDLLTPTEKVMLSKRVAIAYLLLKKYPYGVIKDVLKVSSPTIWNISTLLKNKGKGYKNIMETISKKKEVKNLLDELTDTVVEILTSNKKVFNPKSKSSRNRKNALRKSPL